MDTGQLVELLKIKLGIASNLRDKTLEKIVSSVISELTNNLGVELVPDRADHEMFIVNPFNRYLRTVKEFYKF